MDFEERLYYDLNRKLLNLLGQWPFENERRSRYVRIFTLISTWLGILFQVPYIISGKIRKTDLLVVVPNWGATIIPALCTCNFTTIQKNMKILMLKMSVDWKLTRTKEEDKIKHKYATFGKMITIGFTVYVCIGWPTFIIFSFHPKILDIFIPLNESRPFESVCRLELFIDDGRYLYPVLAFSYFLYTVCLTFTVANATIFVVFIQHACGMYEVLSYRLQITLSTFVGNANEDHRRNYNKIAFCICYHSQILEFVNLLEDTYKIHLLTSFGANTLVLIISMADVTNFKSISLAFATICLNFLGTQMGQKLFDKSTEICEKLIDSCWYEHSLKTKKLLLLIIIRSQRQRPFRAPIFISLVLEDFGKIMRLAISYCMVIRQYK